MRRFRSLTGPDSAGAIRQARRRGVVPGLGLGLGLAVLSLAGCSAPKEGDPRTEPPLVRTAVVASASGGDDQLSGVIRARVEADLGFRVAGKVSERLVDLGAHVHQGQALARLDPQDYALALTALLVVLWLYILVNTLRGVLRGTLFQGKPIVQPEA